MPATRRARTRKTTRKGTRKYGKGASKRVSSAMRRRKKGTLRSGRSGAKVKSRKQAIAIGLSEARAKGAKVPRRKKEDGPSGVRQPHQRLTSTTVEFIPEVLGRMPPSGNGRARSGSVSCPKQAPRLRLPT